MNKMLLVLMLVVGAGATTGLVLQDSLNGETTVAVSQAILIDYTEFDNGDVSGGIDEALVTVMDDGTAWSVHVEANNGDLINIDLPVVNEADGLIVGMLSLHGTESLDLNVDPLFYWSDRNHNGEYDTNEAVIDQRPTTDKLELERDDIVVATGWTDYNNFTANHWFFDGSYTAPGTYGFGGAYGPSYNDDMFSDYDGEDPEAIFLDDGDGILNPGVLANGSGSPDELVLEGRAGLAQELGPYAPSGVPSVSGAVGKLYFDASGGASWSAGKDLFLNNDGDSYFTMTADGLVDDDGTTTSGIGGAGTAIVVGTFFDGFDTSDSVYWDDVDVSSDWSAGDHLWLDAGDNAYFNENGESISGAGPSTNLATTLNPSLDINFDGGGATTYVLESSNSITARTLSEIGLEGTSVFSAGGIAELGATGSYFIVDTTSGALGSSTITLIGDGTVAGDSVAGSTFDTQNVAVGAQIGSVTVAGAQAIAGNGRLTLAVDDGFGGLVDTSGLTAGSVVLIDDDGTPDGTSLYVIIDDTGAAGSSSVTVLSDPLDGIDDNDVFWTITPSDAAGSDDIDDFYLDSGADIASALDDAIGVAGSATFGSAGFAGLYKIDSATVGAGSSVVVTDAASNNVADDLNLGVANGGDENGPDMIIRDSPTDDTDSGVELDTAGSSHKFGYLDLDTDNVYDDGEDIYQEETAGALTYTTVGSLPETVVYIGGDGLQLSTPTLATYLEAGDGIWFRNTDHDSPADYDLGEPLLVADDEFLDTTDEVLARYDGGGVWPALASLDAFRLETDFNGANGHHYYYVDDDNDQWYDANEAIIDQIGGSDLINLEKSDLAPATDFVIHHGLANLLAFPIVQVEGAAGEEWWGVWKFEIPNVNIIGDPLEIRIIVAIEDAAPTGFYEIVGKIWPVNV